MSRPDDRTKSDGWLAIPGEMGSAHVVPMGEPHSLSPWCRCAPRVSPVDEGDPAAGVVYIHQSRDGREAVEWAESILNA